MDTKEGMLLDGPRRDEVSERGWGEDDMLLTDRIDHTVMEEYSGEMLFSQTSNDGTPPLSQSSTISATASTDSTISLADLNCTSLVRTNLSQVSRPIPIATTSMLADAAFRSLMGAAPPRRQSKLQILQLRTHPQVPMSTFVPSMFSPGFKNSIAGHSRLLLTISHALSATMPKTVQTPSLRRKLMELSVMESSLFKDPNNRTGQPGTVERLSSVVQSRLWAMAQRKLFKKAAGRRLWRQVPQGDDGLESDFEDMLATLDEDGRNTDIVEDDGMADEEMLFADDEVDDLLLGDDNDRYNADWERRAINGDTDDLFLADEWRQNWGDSFEDLLLRDGSIGMETVEGNGDIVLQGQNGNEMLLDETDKDILKKADGEISILLLYESEAEEMLV
ncbi:hypothetical protein BKA64DRAFT_437623 [Cadophora sp. MPI-SDFR-AT-0126]|nr:hypothetical protein BKA64DRAFT_437623 [Leotiomycetes sp. MPI-SDFR-AT-0126]